MEGLGRVFNVVPTAVDTPWINLRDAAGVSFVCVGQDTYTIQSASDVGGSGAADLAVVTQFYYSSGAAGATAWAKHTQAAVATVNTTALSAACAVVHVSANSLPAGHSFVRISSAVSGAATAILHDLAVQRDPTYLAAPATSA